MQQMFNRMDGLYLREICVLIDATMKYQLRKQSAAEIEKLNREEKSRNKRKEGTYKPYPKNPVLWIREHEQFKQQVIPPIQILMRTYHIGEKQAVAKIKILEYVSVGEKVMLRL